ncbi:MAG: hypothetical protein A2509_03875 [Candidatus Edwardsbacteria bacterium RIFOXYD12_FULL_50_11]|jgi:hypothetical protein|uniref:Zinc-finger domain-containing protein n=1 Tax=Candidatus Edwardsbacteria bacterium GWF2_54_11 TaxID=1817851 RepID=A0A1F5R7Q5_9BACT|nr:MAG: hypothetical protein A2502_05080 [Candidatus Edwardsbacteria bacterium RifOxyC12_full_54_24]OGF07829.1 MAG: hypothetical protein A2273_05035 [Candidatus Edwardsbacteria bacterium RifOxyA12_full_54_48]OGF10078.1 MAG: hypothetical protein A3K15_11450 [Candidatus Edwardsbacteria bacterium GWE2_54_12]OGF10455.1 MAG: hypothetical protein A2024_08865 [Candidatus Edwardsbacteria bacterium GWF2_54_11]OGF14990.1 MAG: hypothetical protein A2509_03875 [Candidatus Edwardsbacteria bacterium RIFOXYD1
MNCRKIEEHLRENPGAPLPGELQEHLARCPDCSRRWVEQRALSEVLKTFPQAELPAYLGAKALSRLEGRQTAFGKRMLEPGWLTLAAPAMALIVAFTSLIMRYEYRPQYINLSERPASARNQGNNSPTPGSAQNQPSNIFSQIYPVWPSDQDVVGRQDLTIMASLYPDHQGKVQVLLDDIDVSAGSTISSQYISYDPKSLVAGEHMVRVVLQQADGSYQTASWSFYLLEEPS